MIGKEDDDDDTIIEPEEEDEEEEEKKEMSLSEQKIVEERTNMMISYFFFSMVWSVGGSLDANSRIKFDEFFRSLCDTESGGASKTYPKYVQCTCILYCVLLETKSLKFINWCFK